MMNKIYSIFHLFSDRVKSVDVLSFIYMTLFMMTYYFLVYPTYHTNYFSFVPSISKTITAYLLLMVMLWFIPKNNSKFSTIALYFHLNLIYIPVISMYAMGGDEI